VTRGRLPSLVVAAVVAAACTDAAGPVGAVPRHGLAAAGTGVTLDQQTSVLNDGTPWGQGGTHVGKGFQPTNPHLGDAIVATFFWRGTTNTITTVADHLCDTNGTPVGNTYTLVDYVTAGGYSMATYVATNVQGFPDPATTSEQLLCVHAIFSNAITEGGEMLSAYQGVASTAASALGAFHSATGSGSTTTVADPGAIPVGAGALAYAVTMSDTVVGTDPPAGFTVITDVSDSAIKADGEYEVVASAGSVDPTWNWYFTSAHSWLATALALNPATATNQPPVAAFTSSCSALTCAFTSSSSDPDGTISAYSWTFGDGGTSTAQNPSRTYATAGTFTVTLTVTDNQGATNAVSHTVTVTAPNQPPVAAFSSSCSGLSCSFTSTSSDPDGTISAYSWTFGDGGTSTAQNPSHTYGAGGTATVTLIVTDNQGATNTVSLTLTVTAPNTAPVVNAGPNQTVVVGLLYTLSASFSDPDNGPWTYTINWGDGSSSSGSLSTQGTFYAGHTYVVPLTQHTVTVTVTDSLGASGHASKVVTVLL